MSRWQIVALVLVALGFLTLIIATWGSMGSVMCTFCLLIMGAAVLYRKFVLERDEDMFDWDA